MFHTCVPRRVVPLCSVHFLYVPPYVPPTCFPMCSTCMFHRMFRPTCSVSSLVTISNHYVPAVMTIDHRLTITCSCRLFLSPVPMTCPPHHRHDHVATGSESIRPEEIPSITPSLTRQACPRCDTCSRCSLTLGSATHHVRCFHLYLHHA